MAGITTILSDSASPHRLRKTNSPFIARAIFEDGSTKAQENISSSSNDSNSNINNRSNPGSQCGSFCPSKSDLNGHASPMTAATFEATAQAIPDKPREMQKETRMNQLITSYSNPSLLRATGPNLSGPASASQVERQAGKGARYGRSVSMVIDSPSSESASSRSPTSTLSVDSWGDQVLANAGSNTNSHNHKNSATSPNEAKGRLQGLKAVESSPPTMMSQSQPTLTSFEIGPIARMNFREQTAAKDEALLQTSQMLAVPGKERVLAKQCDSGDAPPCLDLHPFSPYSPGILYPESAAAISQHSSGHKQPLQLQQQPIDLNEYCKRVDVRPKEDDDEESDEEEEENGEEGEQQHLSKEEEVERELKVEGVKVKKVDVTEQATAVKFEQVTTVISEVVAVIVEAQVVESTSALDAADVTSGPQQESEHPVYPVEDRAIALSSTESITQPSMDEPTTESEAIAKQWRRDQSTSLLIQRPDGSTVEHIVHHETFSQSQFLEKRQRRHGSQGKFGSTNSLKAPPRKSSSSPPSPLVNSCSGARLESPDAATMAAFEVQASMSEDDASIPAPSISTDGSTVVSTMMQLESPASSTDSSHTVVTQGRRPAKIDTTFPRPDTSASKVLDKNASSKFGKNTPTTEKEQVVASKVSRSGKLFAKKTKTIAVFEYNTAKKLGKGNFGIVYQGNKIHESKAEVAIKKITRKLPGEIEKLGLVQREMRVCRLFNNRMGIIPLLDIITTNKHHYLVFEKADGDLADMLRARCRDALGRRSNKELNQQPLSPSCCLGTIFSIQEIRSIMRTVVLGAQALHKDGYSHKDIKPANILFRNGQGLLCDFGLCSQIEELPRNQFFGTQDYASPEARRVGGHRSCDYIQSDVYSLGAVLYELATGSVLSKVISHGLNWQKITLFGGKSFSELLQGMVNDLEKRWDIDQVVNSPFWNEWTTSTTTTMTSPCTPNPVGSMAMTASKGGSRQKLNPADVALPPTPITLTLVPEA